MKRATYIFIIINLFTILYSCKKGAEQNTQRTKGNTKNTLQTIAFDSITVDQNIPLIKGKDSPKNFLSIHLIYPSFLEDSNLLKKVQETYITEAFSEENYSKMNIKEAVDAFCEHYKNEYLATLTDYKEANTEGYDMSTWGDAYYKMIVDTTASTSGIISFKKVLDSYNGGAHGSHQIYYYNVDTKTGKQIMEKDLFKTGYEKELIKAITNQLMTDNKLTNTDDLEEKGFFDLKDLKTNNNFLIQKDGILYIFNEYEIAPYYMGTIKVFIPNSKISKILKAEIPQNN